MNIRIVLFLMLLGMAMARKGSTPTDCRKTDCRSINVDSSSGDRETVLSTLEVCSGNRPTSIFGGRPTTSSVFGERPTINRPVSTFGNSHNHGSSFGSFGNSQNHGSGFAGSSSIGFGSGVSIGFGQSHLGSSSFGNSFGSSGDCRYWCRTPQGQTYCCENSHQASGGGFSFVKPGQCPPVRPFCPPTRSFRPPSQCSSDARCTGSEKCCFDICLQHHTCKPPQGGFFGR